MLFNSNSTFAAVLLSALVAQVAPTYAASCMVVGESTARVSSAEGEKSPVFLTQACESLRLVSGNAMVTWVARDGKPNFAPIGPTGPQRVPTAGAEERSGKSVWAELSTKREAVRPAFMRALDEERPARVYVPVAGLSLPSKPGTQLKVTLIDGAQQRTVLEASGAQNLTLGRDALQLGSQYTLEWSQDGRSDKWRWKLLSEAETLKLDESHSQIVGSGLSPDQTRIVEAMFYEQLKLNVNMGFALAGKP